MLSNYLDQIRLTLEGKECISYRYLAVELNVKVDAAKRMLYEFHDKNSQHFATIAIGGFNKDGMYRTVVVPRTEVDASRGQFSKIMTEFVYSLHINKSSQWQEEVAQLDFEQMSNLFAEDCFVEKVNRIGSVSCDLKHNVLLPAGTKVSVNRVVPPVPPARTVSTPAAAASSSGSGGAGNQSNPFTIGKSVSAPNTSIFGNNSTAPVKTTVSAAVSGFFSKNTVESKLKPKPKGASTTVDASSTQGSADKTASPAGAAVSATSRVIQDDEDDDEWDDGSGYKPKKSNLAKRVPKNKSILDDDEVWDDAKTAKDTDPVCTPMEVENVVENKGKKGKHALVQRGAMDDFVNDGSFEGDAKVGPGGVCLDEGVNGSGSGAGGRKKKLVEKTFENEKGYLVTEMVWEEMSAEEEAELARQAAVAAAEAEKRAAALAAKKAAAPVPSKKGSTTNSGGTQKGMMAFFGAKK